MLQGTNYSDYIVYVDESGDENLKNIDPDYPILVLVFCIFDKKTYSYETTPKFKDFKFRHFGHDMVVLHEKEIKKYTSIILDDLTCIIKETEFTIIASVIRKDKIKYPINPYEYAVKFCLERLYYFLQEKQQEKLTTHIIIEKRDKNQNNILYENFSEICSKNISKNIYKFEIKVADKQTNSTGMQIADLIAKPIGRNTLKPQQKNRAYEVIETKFRKSKDGVVNGFGIKVFP